MVETCAKCGKRFLTHGYWGYAYGGHLTCSYHCMRDMWREDCNTICIEMELRGLPKYTRMTDAQKQDVEHMRKFGYSYNQIAELTGLGAEAIRLYCKRNHITIVALGEEAGGQTTEKETETMENETKAPETKEPETKLTEAAEAAVTRARKTAQASAEPIDKARIISTLCDAVALLRKLCEGI